MGSDSTTVDLAIDGMTCASCARRVEQRLDALDGVERASVNLATEHATVVLQPGSSVDLDRLVHTVRDIGYGATATHASHPHSGSGAERVHALDAHPGRRVAACAAATLPVAVLAMVGAAEEGVGAWTTAVLATGVALGGGWPIHRSALRGLLHRSVGMDTLVSIGVLAAWAWSFSALLIHGGGELYFEVAAVVTTLVLLGRLIEHRAKRDAGAALRALLELGPRTATVILSDGDERDVPVGELQVGDRFVVRPGQQIATDGVVESGTSSIDAALITGESVPVDVAAGDDVVGATINTTGRLVIRATKVGADTALARIARLVEDAQRGTAPVQRIADRVAAIFVPIVLALAAATLVGWIATGHSVAEAIAPAVAVLIVACPCALGLATPTALLVGTGRGAQLGLLIKGPQVLESTRRIDTMLLDKTGTLTTGAMQLVDGVARPGADLDVALVRAAAVERGSEHPLARAIVTGTELRGLVAPPTPTDIVAEIGVGVRGTVDGTTVWVTRPDAAGDERAPLDARLIGAIDAAEDQGRTAVLVGWDDVAQAVLVIADTVRAESAEAVADLRALGIDPILLSGDNHRAAHAVAAEVGITTVVADVRPAGKVAEVERLQRAGRVVAMLGDGINDAPALARADLGLAVGSGTDVALEAGDVVLLSNDPRAAAAAVRLSRRTLATIRGNLFWAFAYNVAALPLAVAGLVEPMIASAAMALSSIFVVSNSLRLRRFER